MALTRAEIAAYEALIERRRSYTAAQLRDRFLGLGRYNAVDIEAYERLVRPVLAASKQSTVAASNAFISRALGVPPQPVRAAAVEVVADLRQPFTATWHALKMGRPFEDALRSGGIAADQVGDGFVHSTARRTGDHVAERAGKRVTWARIPSANACEFCRTVAGDRYLSAESADFGHVPCHCAVVPGA